MQQYPQVKSTFLLSGNFRKWNDRAIELSMIGNGKVTLATERRSPQFATDEWSLSGERKNCKALVDSYESLQLSLESKMEVIKKIREKYNLSPVFIISIYTDACEYPEMVLTPNFMNFLAQNNIELHFSIS